MLTAAFSIFDVAVIVGSILAIMHLREEVVAPHWSKGALHVVLALGDFSVLLRSL
jgi:hypothetical protein